MTRVETGCKSLIGFLDDIFSLSNKNGWKLQEGHNYINITIELNKSNFSHYDVVSFIKGVVSNSQYIHSRMSINLRYESVKKEIVRVGQQTDKSKEWDELVDLLADNGNSDLVDGLLTYENEIRSKKTIAEPTNGLISLLIQDELQIQIKLQISKQKVGEKLIQNTEKNSTEHRDYKPQFWKSLDNLEEVIKEDGLEDYLAEFSSKKQPVLYLWELPSDLDSSNLYPIFSASDRGELNHEGLDRYKYKMEMIVALSAFDENSGSVHPSIFASISDQSAFVIPFVHTLFSLLSERVESVEVRDVNTYKYIITGSSGKITEEIYLNQYISSNDSICKLKELYDEVSVHEDQEIFIKIWRRSIIYHCEDFSKLDSKVDRIIDRYHIFEEELVESKLNDLSNAIRDVHTFMTETVNQVTTTSANLSNELQRLTLTVAIGLLVNIFFDFEPRVNDYFDNNLICSCYYNYFSLPTNC